jgi:hypothetical protein
MVQDGDESGNAAPDNTRSSDKLDNRLHDPAATSGKGSGHNEGAMKAARDHAASWFCPERA